MDDEPPIRKKLSRALAALESQEWRFAVAALRDCEFCASPEEIVEDPWTALTIARAAWVSPWECLVELQILCWNSEDDAYLKMDAERVPTAIADQLFSAAVHRFGRAASNEAWDEMRQYAELLLELPGASDGREQVLLDLFAGLIDRANAVGDAIEAQGRRQSRVAEREQFTAIWSMIGLATQSSAYDIATSLLIGLLRGAAKPILRMCNAATVILLWPELVAIWNLHQKHNLREVSKEWLRRTVCEDEPDEHAAMELEEP